MIDFGISKSIQFQRADYIVFVSVCFKDVLDFQAVLLGDVGINLTVPAWVNYSSITA